MTKTYLYIAETARKGRGMFTKKPIKAGTVIESAPVIVMTGEERKLIDQTLLYNYIFEWQPDGADMCCMALGNIPIYNHSYTSNCEYFMDYEKSEMYVQTVRDIEAGEELTINYNGNWDDPTPVWFDMAGE
ncbi:MAG: SET domain-containing protein-lysine N-methyltransferase [Flavipsychrobacter sp.]|nr:SET domain-containing protein-lysine N-methyltransferase [Flavipsychrobacter sp.]